ncbi:type VII secretion protein EccB [Saccharopolyspora subtropica]|uniref:Type VII secretion protein EccB n=2 Tax=Saccharopolyspora thermophila TaxID=89367 RepID=A0A917N6R3_9PSEU|nr:type VII secretion protein EccB [Saccharopolyspora subtropica]
MLSRRDQVQAYFFMVGRLVSALMRGRPDDPATPNRRLATGTIIGLLIGALVVAGFTVYGFISPGGKTSWQAAGTIIVEKETGARYLYLDGELRPVLNYSSALLVVNSPQATVQSVSRNSLADVPRGAPIGIANAPDSLPAATNLTRAPWVACATSRPGVSPDERVPVTKLHIGAVAARPLPAAKGVLVSAPDGLIYLVWQGRRYLLPDQSVLDSLGYSDTRAFPVSTEWISAMPAGPDLRPPEVPGAGAVSQHVSGARVGQVFEVINAVTRAKDYYVLLSNGLAPLTPTSASLLLASPTARAAYPGRHPEAIQAEPDLLSSTRRSTTDTIQDGYPTTLPALERIDVGRGPYPCATFAVDARSGPTIALVDRVEMPDPVPPNSGVLARDVPAPGGHPGTFYLITDLGAKYPLADAKVAEVLGYGGVEPVLVPTDLLRLLPTGPALDPDVATVSQPVNATGSS